MDAGNWIALLLGVGTLVLGAFNTYAQWPHKEAKTQFKNPVIWNAILCAVVVIAVGYDIYDRSRQRHIENVLAWGGLGESYYMTIATHELQGSAKTMRLMLVVRPAILGVDPMTDGNIGKSGLYTIAGANVTLAVPMNTPLRMVPQSLNLMDYNAVLLPLGTGPERIRTLADVLDLGGKIFEARATSVMAGPAIPNFSEPK
jgi:hypothetical protein